jgi:hypothetical protein
MYLKCIFSVGVTIIGLIAATIVAADDDLPYDFPRYASEATCNTAYLVELDDDLRRSKVEKCIELEQTAYDLLKSVWKSVSIKNKNTCEETTKAGSYSSLNRCIVEKQKQDKLPLQIVPKS